MLGWFEEYARRLAQVRACLPGSGERLLSLPALFVPGGSPTPTHVSPPLPPLCPPQGVYRVEALSPSHPWSRGISLFPRQAPHMAIEVTRGVQVSAPW